MKVKEAQSHRRLRVSLKGKFLAGFIILSILLCGGLSTLGYIGIRDRYITQYTDKALSAANIAAGIVNADALTAYRTTLQKDAEYEKVSALLGIVKGEIGMEYLYVFYPAEEGYFYIYDAQTALDNSEDVCALGDTDPYTAGNTNLMRVFNTGKATENMLITDTSLGYVGTVFVPVFDSAGAVVALVGADVSMLEVKDNLQAYLMQTVITSVVTVFAFVSLYLIYLSRTLVSPIHKLTGSVTSYAESNDKLAFNPIHIHSGDEVEELSHAFEKMAHDIEAYIDNLQKVTADKQRIATELDVATQIQLSVLPRIFPPFPDCRQFDIFATMDTAKEVGGDFYDLFRLDEDRLCFLIADVSGKGVPAALFMMIAKALIKNSALEGKPLDEVLKTVNNQLSEGNESNMFVTALIMMYDSKKSTLTYCSAGHNPPLLRRKNGQFDYMKLKRSLPLAAMEGISYKPFETDFHPGDMVFLYTDGVTEALNQKKDLYSEERLQHTLNAIEGIEAVPSAQILPAISKDIQEFAMGAEQADDITMLIMRANGNP